jgi:ubiquinone/menaquinone biosynthesis C-methylase UbiE
MTKRRELEARFRERYSAPVVEAARIVEREVIGANVGANGYTTVRQADLLAGRLDLGKDTLLLDIGSGRGWPGVYLARNTGCRVVLTDPQEAALAAALERSKPKALSRSVSAFQASATHMPFARRSFDAITHTDTL